MRDLGIESCTCNIGHCTCSTSSSESYCGFHHTVYNYIIVRCCCTLNTYWPATVSGCCEPSTHTPEITYHMEWVYCLYCWCAVYSCKINAWYAKCCRKEFFKEGPGRCHTHIWWYNFNNAMLIMSGFHYGHWTPSIWVDLIRSYRQHHSSTTVATVFSANGLGRS